MSTSYNSRVQLKIDTSTNWAKATNFAPLKGEIVLYSDLKKFKIGDGTTKINALDFAYDDFGASAYAKLCDDANIDVPEAEKATTVPTINFMDDVLTAVATSLNNKVDKVSGKQLSTNDYTTTEKNKLAGIAEGANAYTLPTATSSVLGGVKVGANISLSSGTISLSKANVTTALGYTPPTTANVESYVEWGSF